jgi:hypothetical protein
MIYEHEGKKYIRMGECNNCGACEFVGYIKPCPHLILNSDSTTRCKIHNQLSDIDDTLALEVSNIHTSACSKYPNGLGDLGSPEIRNKCGYYFLEIEKILVACPVHECKEYSFQRWIDNVKSFTYPLFDIFVVDNSAGEDFINRYKDQIPMVHIETDQGEQRYLDRITASMSVIQKKFLTEGYDRWFNLECDIIPPKDIIEFMLYWGRNTDWIGHAFPLRFDVSLTQATSGIGCSMLSRKLIEAYDYKDADSPDAWLWAEVQKAGKFSTMELWYYINIEHLRQ